MVFLKVLEIKIYLYKILNILFPCLHKNMTSSHKTLVQPTVSTNTVFVNICFKLKVCIIFHYVSMLAENKILFPPLLPLKDAVCLSITLSVLRSYHMFRGIHSKTRHTLMTHIDDYEQKISTQLLIMFRP